MTDGTYIDLSAADYAKYYNVAGGTAAGFQKIFPNYASAGALTSSSQSSSQPSTQSTPTGYYTLNRPDGTTTRITAEQAAAFTSQGLAAGYSVKPEMTTSQAPATSTTTSTNAASLLSDLAVKNPVVAAQLQDPATKAWFDSAPPELQVAYLQAASSLDSALASGKVVNPNIQLTDAENRKLLDQATQELDPYYQEKFGISKNDFQTSISRLMEDYQTGINRTKDTFKQDLANQAEGEAQAGTAYSSGRVDRQGRTLNLQQNTLDDAVTAATRAGQDAAKTYEQQAGTSNLRSLNIPGLSTFQATPTGVNTTGSRNLYAPLGTVPLGEIGKAKETAISARKSQLESAFRSNRLLDLTSL